MLIKNVNNEIQEGIKFMSECEWSKLAGTIVTRMRNHTVETPVSKHERDVAWLVVGVCLPHPEMSKANQGSAEAVQRARV